ncbi:hypothetical protein BGP_2474 [Beggiatoa sp. PS]|nr:hypothetical protein BGP_2474 [Beggiatoa sp. PS]
MVNSVYQQNPLSTAKIRGFCSKCFSEYGEVENIDSDSVIDNDGENEMIRWKPLALSLLLYYFLIPIPIYH